MEIHVKSYAYFLMDSFYRNYLIERHSFFVEQSTRRLLGQFENIEMESKLLSDEWLDSVGLNFDPDRHDPSDFLEKANDLEIEYHQLLVEMQNMTRLNIISGMFHLWEKSIRDWIAKEVLHWHRGYFVNKQIWSIKFEDLMGFLSDLGWRVREESFFIALDQCRQVVNVYKHGEGSSFEQLTNSDPQFFKSVAFDEYTKTTPTYSELTVTDEHIDIFSAAITEFWKAIPAEVRGSDNFELPRWFENAFNKDLILKSDGGI